MTHSLRHQRTLAHSAVVDGFGYWSGRDVRLEFRPAAPDTGVVFLRTDLPRPVRIPVNPACRVEMPRRTTLAAGGATSAGAADDPILRLDSTTDLEVDLGMIVDDFLPLLLAQAEAEDPEEARKLKAFVGLLGLEALDRLHLHAVSDGEETVTEMAVTLDPGADGGLLASKPYVASGRYIDRMSDYCHRCRFDPTQAEGETACPFTTLFWDFLDRHRERFANHPRTALMWRNLGRLEPGTPTTLIACSAAHRDTGVFEAARYGIDRLKEIVPIWKKEITPTGEEWVEGPYTPIPSDL